MWFAQVEPTTITYTTVEPSGGMMGALAAVWFVWLIVLILMIVAMWKIFEKAGEAGWKSIIPIYNTYTLFRIAGRNGLWFLALFVPILNIVALIMLALDLAKHFGKSTAFALGFGDAKYVGTKHA